MWHTNGVSFKSPKSDIICETNGLWSYDNIPIKNSHVGSILNRLWSHGRKDISQITHIVWKSQWFSNNMRDLFENHSDLCVCVGDEEFWQFTRLYAHDTYIWRRVYRVFHPSKLFYAHFRIICTLYDDSQQSYYFTSMRTFRNSSL